MADLKLTDASHTQMARAARLHKREQRKRHNQSLVEGPQALRELLACAPALARDLYATREALARHEDIEALAADAQVYTHLVDEHEFAHLTRDGQGLLAVINLPEPWNLTDVLSEAHLALGCVEMSDPGNLGTLIRVADAAGADAVLLGQGSAEVFSPKTIRSTAGSIFHIPVVEGLPLRAMADAGRAAGLQILGADAGAPWPLDSLVAQEAQRALHGVRGTGPSLSAPTLWILGNEAHGFAGEDTSLFDSTVSIPIFGAAESLNVSVAAAVLAYSSVIAAHLL